MTTRSFVLFAASMCWGAAAMAHHNATSHYDLDKSITLEGVVTNFRMVNPHAQLYFDVSTDGGETERWVAEGNSVGVLTREGWSRDELKKGDQITLTGRPSRDRSHLVLWTTIKRSDGTVLYGGNSISTFSEQGVPENVRDHIEELRKRQIEERERKRDAAESGTDENHEKQQPTQSY